ncbi:CD109 antigen-like [Pomacea canaliculata]|uniref:CD109 antigen-like n=1 Tax=Pomacea canaliculata TaxID=400727 RepID=UPI000D737E2C|nr:CD109 antigen-like [Pomacea canaliculata]
MAVGHGHHWVQWNSREICGCSGHHHYVADHGVCCTSSIWTLRHSPGFTTDTFQDMFVSLDLPYSAIRGEDICLKTFAFNYHNRPLQMRMTLGQADGLENVVLEPAAGDPSKLLETRRSVIVSQDLGFVRPNTTQEADFCFTPTKLGNLPIRVNLTSSVHGDGVEHILMVEPEGSPAVRTVSVFLDAKPNVVFSKSVPLNFPSTAVRGSQVITVRISGNLLVPVISNLEKLLRLPTGCGEQNMILFAPNVFLINYLQRTNTYTTALGAQAQNFMLTGYQKELTFQRKDGSFSTWGKNDPSGSMWLTAFVTKCFVQAMALKNNVITIDSKTVRSSIQWITTLQKNDGSFPEPGNVVHKEMQSGSAQGEAMTAFVLISLAEASVKFQGLSPGEQQSLQNSISKARDYLEARLNVLTDPYDLAIVTYALHLVRSGSKDIAFELLQKKIITNVYTKHWERNQQSAALNIEMTSYGLLTYILRSDVAGAMPILRWLMELRGPNGGFISTQDTVVGLQALGEMAAANHNPVAVPFTVTVSWSSGGQAFKKDLTIDDSTKMLLQTVDVTIVNGNIPSEVQISASTSGTFTQFPEAKVVMEYNINDSTTSEIFQITYQVVKASVKTFTVVVEAKRVDGKQGGMTLLEVGIPTGFSVDLTHPSYSVPTSKLQEQGHRKYILYYDEVNASGVRASLPMSVSQGIPVNTQPVPIKIYDYYEPGGKQQLTVYYQLSQKKVFVCDSVAKYKDCSSGSLPG